MMKTAGKQWLDTPVTIREPQISTSQIWPFSGPFALVLALFGPIRAHFWPFSPRPDGFTIIFTTMLMFVSQEILFFIICHPHAVSDRLPDGEKAIWNQQFPECNLP
jgi:hypothetical protein